MRKIKDAFHSNGSTLLDTKTHFASPFEYRTDANIRAMQCYTLFDDDKNWRYSEWSLPWRQALQL